jgi:DNA-directed RNA polymerase specialized sigma24 family protein
VSGRSHLKENFVSSIASRYGERLRSFLTRRLRNTADAPDLAQEVFLRLMRQAGKRDRREAVSLAQIEDSLQ